MAYCPNNCISGEIRVETGRDENNTPIIYTTDCPCAGNGYPSLGAGDLGPPN